MQSAKENLTTLFENLEKIVGKENIYYGPKDTFEFNKTLIYFDDQQKDLIYLFPKNKFEVQKIIQLANEVTLPFWVCGRGQNWGYGTMTTTFKYGFVINMKRMNQILEVNADLAYAVIEPGVTYQQLHDYLIEKKIPLQIDCNDSSPSCSVLGNALERGIGVTPYADHFGQLCGFEIITPTGELIKTGGNTGEHDKNFHLYKYGTGPYIEGLFSQSNFGVVISSGIHLMPKADSYTSFVFEFENDENYFSGMNILRELLLQERIKSRIHLCNDITTLCLFRQYPYDLLKSDETYLNEENLDLLRKKYGIKKWSAAGGLFGTPNEISLYKKMIKKELRKFAKIQFITQNQVKIVSQIMKKIKERTFIGKILKFLIEKFSGKHVSLIEVLENSFGLLRGIPTEFFVRHAYFKSPIPTPQTDVNPAKDECGCLWFAPLVPNTTHDVKAFTNTFKAIFHRHGFDYYAAQLMMPRTSIILLSLFFNKKNKSEYDRALKLYDELCNKSIEMGYQQYRTSTLYMDRILDQSPSMKQYLKTMKSAIDPKNVFAPGKYGI